MAIIASVPENDQGDFKPAPAGTHHAVCVDVVDLGYLRTEYAGNVDVKRKIRIAWQLKKRDPENDNRPFLVTKRYTLSLSKKANLRKDLRSWRGRDFTDEEAKAFDVEKVIGANCLLTVVHNESNGTTYANVDAVSGLAEGMQKIAPDYDAYTRVIDRDNYEPPCLDENEVWRKIRGESGDGADGAAPRQTVKQPVSAAAGEDFDFNADDQLPF